MKDNENLINSHNCFYCAFTHHVLNHSNLHLVQYISYLNLLIENVE